MSIKQSIKTWYQLEKSLGMGRSHYVIGAALLAFFLFWCVAFASTLVDAYREKKEVEKYSYNCALNKGVAMRDLEGKLRCVPTFSAQGAKHNG